MHNSIQTAAMEGGSSLNRSQLKSDVDDMFQEILKMQPTTLSEVEQRMYDKEKIFMRHFVLMKKDNEVPTHLSLEHFKMWLLGRRSFQQEFQKTQMKMDAWMFKHLHVEWTRARILCLNQMQRETYKEFAEEERLSRLLGRKVTLEGLGRYLSTKVSPQAEEETQLLLQSLFNELEMCLSSTEMPGTQIEAFSLFQRNTEDLVEKILELALEYLLKELKPPANEDLITASVQERARGARKEIAGTLVRALASIPGLSSYIGRDDLRFVCTLAAAKITRSIYKVFAERAASFPSLDCEKNEVTAQIQVRNAVEEMWKKHFQEVMKAGRDGL
ncbi:uncharacterized protein LOC133512960 [Syngnathoides biaculeatus]|uniref:uncharacterized protein LOC133512960 n=1 Tax=Syngnathoides biaculeatus TaxID=300417 RepID=UPI002ADDF98D|nr:uncharacterized protein LOC133512960 [Syngnathoides biaculeatus]